MQTANADRLVIARFIADAGYATERWFHRHFSEHHIGGEWFRFCETMLTVDPPTLIDAPPQPRNADNARRAFAAARAANICYGSNQTLKTLRDDGNALSIREAAAKHGISARTVKRAKTILIHGGPEDEADVISGRVSLLEKALVLTPKRIPKIKVAKRSRPGRPRKDEWLAS